jgi:hypothetical protein
MGHEEPWYYVLFLPVTALSEDTLAPDDFRQWIVISTAGSISPESLYGRNIEGPDTASTFNSHLRTPWELCYANARHVHMPFETINEFETLSLSEDFVLLAPSGNCEGVLKRPRVPPSLQTQIRP